MAERFSYEAHKKRMRELLKPPAATPPLFERIRGAIRGHRLPKRPRLGV